MRQSVLLASLVALVLPAHAQRAHVHGEGKLEVVIVKGSISINLELPLDVAVGFERAPKTDKETAALAAARQALAEATMFVPSPAAACTAEPARIDMPSFDARQAGDHADIDASYVFRCTNPGALKSIETGIFKGFKRLYRLEAQRVGPNGQGAMRLTPKNPVISW